MSFDKIVRKESIELKSAPVLIKGSDNAEYKFTVNELSPYEMTHCVDEFGKVDFVLVIARSVRDQDGARMSLDQANNLPSEVLGKFVNAYNSFFLKEVKKKVTAKKKAD